MTITASHFRHKGTTYSVGHVVDIEPEYFDASRMVKVEEATVTAEVTSQPIELGPRDTDCNDTEQGKPELQAPSEPPAKPKRSRRKRDV